MKKNKSYDLLYLGIWIIPFIFFARDFFQVRDFFNILNERTLKILFFTLKQSFYSSSLALLLGIIPGIYLSKSKGLLKNLVEGSLFIPFFFPVISTVVSFTILFNLDFLKNFNILYTLKGIVIVNTFYNIPIFVKYISEGLRSIDYSLIEAFSLESKSVYLKFTKIYFPLIIGTIKKSYFLAFSYCFTSFAIILSIGGINFTTFEVAIATTLRGSFDFSKAFSYGLIQFLFLLIFNIFMGRDKEKIDINREEKLGRSNIFEVIYVIGYLAFEYGIVIISLIFSIYNYLKGQFTLEFLLRLFDRQFNNRYPVVEALFNSALIATIASTLTILLVYILLKNKHRYTHITILSSLGLSSAFLGICFVYMNILFDIPYMLLLVGAYLVIGLPIAYSFMHFHIENFDKQLLEASYIDGANRFKAFLYIELPILKDIFLSTFLQVFAVIFAEFTISYTMQISDYLPTISIINYSMANSKYFLESSALSGLTTLIVLSIFLLSQWLLSKKKSY